MLAGSAGALDLGGPSATGGLLLLCPSAVADASAPTLVALQEVVPAAELWLLMRP